MKSMDALYTTAWLVLNSCNLAWLCCWLESSTVPQTPYLAEEAQCSTLARHYLCSSCRKRHWLGRYLLCTVSRQSILCSAFAAEQATLVSCCHQPDMGQQVLQA